MIRTYNIFDDTSLKQEIFKICEINLKGYYARISFIGCIDNSYCGNSSTSPGCLLFKFNSCQYSALSTGNPPSLHLISMARHNYPLDSLTAICTLANDSGSKIELFGKSLNTHCSYTLTIGSIVSIGRVEFIVNEQSEKYETLPTGVSSTICREAIIDN